MGSPSEKNSDKKRCKGKRTQRLRNINWSGPRSMPLPPAVSAQKVCKGRRMQRLRNINWSAPQPLPQPMLLPSPVSSQNVCKGRRMQRLRNINWSAPQSVPQVLLAPQSMPLSPPVSSRKVCKGRRTQRIGRIVHQKVCKGRRTQRIAIATIVRQQLPVPQPVPQSLPPQVITTEEEDIELANNLVLLSQGNNWIDRAAAGKSSDEEKDLQLAHNLILLSQGGNLIDTAAAGQSSGAPISELQPTSTELEKVSMEIEIGRQNTIVPSSQSVQSMAWRTSSGHTCNICKKKINSPQALGNQRAKCKKRKRESDNASHYKERQHRCQKCSAMCNSGQALYGHMKTRKLLNGNGDDSKNKKAKVATQEPPSDGLNRIAIQQQPNGSLGREAIQQPANDGLNGIALQQIAGEQQSNGGLDRTGIVQQQPINGGLLQLDLNLPPPPDQDDTTQQPINGGFLHLDLNLQPPPDQDDTIQQLSTV